MKFAIKESGSNSGGRPRFFHVITILVGVGLLVYILGKLFGWLYVEPAPEPIIAQAVAASGAPPELSGCLPEGPGTLIKVFSEHESVVSETNKDAWTWGTVASFKTEDGLVVTCYFRDNKYSDIWEPGMVMRTGAGQRIVGSYRADLEKK